MSELSGTYFRFAGELERSPDFAAGVAVAATALRGGVPGGVVDSATCEWMRDVVLEDKRATRTVEWCNPFEVVHLPLEPIYDPLTLRDTHEPNTKAILPRLLQILRA